MGGNKKQRTKGNVKPSNSQRTAELLSASGVTGFIGFSGLATNLPGYVPPSGQHLSDDVESTVDGDFRMAMRKMTKRDTVTRIKALQEFSQLCQEKDDDLVKGALPFWPRLFNKLALDNDRRLREATHIANEQLMIKVKRSAAPFLKSMMGVWLVSLSDLYAPAASAAKNALNSAVPIAKQSNAFDFCKEEVFHYFQDILIVETAKTISDEREASPAEMEEKYIRLVATSLKALRFFLSAVETQDSSREYIVDFLQKLMKEDKFWKHARHNDPQIRSAWYAVMSSICRFLGESVTEYAQKLCPLTLGRLSEGDPVVAPLIWDASLCVLVGVNDCWKYVNVNKAFLPQLWNFLKEGGKGNASAVYPSLLPLLSKIPVIEDEAAFYSNFFGHFRHGLFLDKVLSSPTERNAIVASFIECLKYVCTQHSGSSDIDKVVVEDLLLNQLLPLLKICVNSSPDLFPKFGYLLLHLENQIHCNEVLCCALNLFWLKFLEFCESIVNDEDPETLASSLSALSCFFRSLQPSPAATRAVKPKVRFEMQVTETDVASDLLAEPREWTKDSLIFASTLKLCRVVLNKLKDEFSVALGNLLLEMCTTLCSKQFFAALLSDSGTVKETLSDDEAPAVFYKSAILPLLLQNSQDRTKCVKSLVHLAFVVCSCTTQQNCVFDVLHELCKTRDATILEEVISKASQSKQAFCRDWLKSAEVGEIILEMAQRLADINSDDPLDPSSAQASWKILNFCLVSSKKTEPVISTECLRKLLDIFHESVQSLLPGCREQKVDITQVIEFVCDLALNLFDSYMDSWCIPVIEKLLLTLFQLGCNFSDEHLHVPAREKVEETWRSGTKKLVSLRGGLLNEDGFLYLASRKIHQLILTESQIKERTEEVEVLTLKFLSSVYEALPESREAETSCLLSSATICSLLQIILPSDDEWSRLESCSDKMDLFLQVLQGRITLCPFEFVPAKTSDGDLICIARVVLRLLKQLAGQGTSVDDPATVELVAKHSLYLIVAITRVKNFYREIEVDDMIVDMLGIFRLFKWEDMVESFLNILSSRSLEEGYIWSLCLAEVLAFLEESFAQVKKWKKDFVRGLDFKNELATFHTLQCLAQQLNPKFSEELASKAVCHLVSVQDVLSCDALGLFGLLSCCKFVGEFSMAVEFLRGVRSTRPEIFLEDRPLPDDNDVTIDFCASAALFLSVVVTKKVDSLTHDQWDSVLCVLTGWLQSCQKSHDVLLRNFKALNLTCQSLHLLYATNRFMHSEEASGVFDGELINEWRELYRDAIISTLLPLFLWISDETVKAASPPVQEFVMLLALNLQDITAEEVVKLFSGEKVEDVENVDYNSIISRFYLLLTHNLQPVRLMAHYICYLLIEKVPHVSYEAQSDSDQDEKMRPPPPLIAKMLETTSPVVDTILSDLLVGDCCLVQPETDAFTYTQAYLFTWLHLLRLFSTASSEVRSEYATYLQHQNYLQSLLLNLFRLMPQNPSLSEKATVTPTRGCASKTMFTEPYEVNVQDAASSRGLQHLACHVYLETLRKLPAMVRQWWTNQDNRTTDIVNKFTADYVSSYICSQEIKCVQVTDVKFENMTVRARPTAREVVARYSVDEITIELVIRLPPNHPLGPVQVETCQRVGVGQTQWRNWLLQLTTFLTYQNGSILDGLTLWKCNVDKRFEGVEECMICFYVLHGSTCQLPKLTCKTCKKKYHSACLYKWFSTSNNSACPLCRNLF